MQPNLPKQGCARPIICFVKKNTLTWDHIAMQNKMVRNVFPNHQNRTNMFHSQIGTRNKTVLWPIWEQCVPLNDRNSDQNSPNLPIWEQCVPLKDIGTRNKAVLNDQFGNSVFHLQIGIRNKTVLNDQFGNSVFHSQIGIRN